MVSIEDKFGDFMDVRESFTGICFEPQWVDNPQSFQWIIDEDGVDKLIEELTRLRQQIWPKTVEVTTGTSPRTIMVNIALGEGTGELKDLVQRLEDVAGRLRW